MPEEINKIAGRGRYSGSILLADPDIIPGTVASLASGASLDVLLADTRHVGDLGGDIIADQACTLTVIPVPDQDDTEGEASLPLSVVASTPARWSYSALKSPRAILRITNSGPAAMTGLQLWARGEA